MPLLGYCDHVFATTGTPAARAEHGAATTERDLSALSVGSSRADDAALTHGLQELLLKRLEPFYLGSDSTEGKFVDVRHGSEFTRLALGCGWVAERVGAAPIAASEPLCGPVPALPANRH
jgi:hypothetical protein